MVCISIPNGFICNGMNPPTEDHECREFGYSMGRACAKCPVECYRNGMTAKEALADNKEMVRAKEAAGFGREKAKRKMASHKGNRRESLND